MSFTHTVIHPTDFSEPSSRAFELACAVAREQGARLIVLYVLPPAVCHGEEVARRQEDFAPELWEQLREIRDPADSIHVEHWLRSGDPVTEIVRAAEESGCNLIVAGTHGRSGVGRALIGSVAEKLLRAAPCPVITLRTRAAGPAIASGKVKRILHPSDFSPDAEAAFRLACSLARDYGAVLRVLHVSRPPAIAPIIGVVPPEPDRERRELTERLAAMALVPHVHVECELVVSDDPGPAIVREAGRADLVVMGTHGRTGIRRALFGSVAEYVVRNASCPVLTMKAPGEPAQRPAESLETAAR